MGQARTVFIGTGPFGVPALAWLAAAGAAAPFHLVGVVSAPGRPSGREGSIQPGPIQLNAQAAGARELLLLPRLRDADAIARVVALRPDLIVLADDARIVPRALLELPHGALNLHPSLLPRHRGATPIPAAILAGDHETGVTIIQMDDGIDTGPIVAVERIALRGTETAPQLEAGLAGLAADLLSHSIGPWLRGELRPRPQNPDGATMTSLLRREDGRLDPAQPVLAMERRVRALQPWPGTFLQTPRGPILVHAASIAPSDPRDRAGTIVAAGPGIALAAGDGRLVLDEAQPPGGRRMSGPELRRGRPWLVGMPIE